MKVCRCSTCGRPKYREVDRARVPGQWQRCWLRGWCACRDGVRLPLAYARALARLVIGGDGPAQPPSVRRHLRAMETAGLVRFERGWNRTPLGAVSLEEASH